MIKNRILRIAAVLLCALTVLPFFAACTVTEGGDSAYEVAVKNGFTGSESEWLASLKGADGKDGVDGKDFSALNTSLEKLYAAAVSEGFVGSVEDYAREVLGIEGEDAFVRTVNRSLLSAVSILAYFEYRTQGTSYASTTKGGSAASGFVYSVDKEKGDAIIVTNYHAVYDKSAKERLSKEIYVSLYGLEDESLRIPAQYLCGSATYDIAVLKITDSELIKSANVTAVEWRSSSDIKLGERVFTAGNAKSMGISTAVGTVTVESMEIEVDRADDNGEVVMRLFRTDAPFNHGNSGGAMFDEDGKVLGVVVAKNVDDEVEGIGYVIPSDIARRAVENLLHSKEVYNSATIKKCLLGITVTYEQPRTYIDEETGAVRRVENVVVKELVASSAAVGKVLVGDIIVSLESKGVTVKADRVYHIVDFMLTVYPGDTVNVTLIRDGQEMTVPVTFGENSITDVP